MTLTHKSQPIEEELDLRIEDILHKLTLKEKVAFLSGIDNWHTSAVERLGIPSITMTDGPHGVRLNQPEANRIYGPATSFPTGVSMASSWDPELIERVGEALGEETRAMECDILLGPCVNIARHPLAGRNFESYSEDPYLAGRIGIGFVKGVQSQGIGTSLKHFACNNQETERGRGSSEIDERTLREIYLPAFEAIVKEANPWTVMCAYNRINGVYASQNNHLLNDILKEEWGYEGVVISDWGANHTTVESVAGGLDIEMPGPAKYYGNLLVEAVNNWQMDEKVIDASVRRILKMIFKTSKLSAPSMLPKGSLNTPEHQTLARELAEQSMVLLKNEGQILPLNLSGVRRIAVIGPNAAEASIGGGGSSFLEPPYRISPLAGLKAKLGSQVQVDYEPGCDNLVDLPPLKDNYVTGGLSAQYFNNPSFEGSPAAERIESKMEFWWFEHGPIPEFHGPFSGRWSGSLSVPTSGNYTFCLINTGISRLYLDGKLLVEKSMENNPAPFPVGRSTVEVKLANDKPYQLTLEFVKPASDRLAHLRLLFAFTPKAEEDDRLARAVKLAKESDIALLFVGNPEGYESEGNDRPNIDLPGRQNELIAAVAAANPRTIVVLYSGVPVAMPWLDDVPALLDGYYPGLEGGHAVANVLTGEVNPSGKLSVTFPKKLADTPAFINFPGNRQVYYGEGIFVGYRYYDQREIEPLFPFGYGLSYTQFELSDFQVMNYVNPDEPVHASVKVKNIGKVKGKEVVQLYVTDKLSSLPRPPKELKGFKKVSLAPCETMTVDFYLDQRAFAFYDPQSSDWIVEPGEFELLIGCSSKTTLKQTLSIE